MRYMDNNPLQFITRNFLQSSRTDFNLMTHIASFKNLEEKLFVYTRSFNISMVLKKYIHYQEIHAFIYKQHFYKQHQADFSEKLCATLYNIKIENKRKQRNQSFIIILLTRTKSIELVTTFCKKFKTRIFFHNILYAGNILDTCNATSKYYTKF